MERIGAGAESKHRAYVAAMQRQLASLGLLLVPAAAAGNVSLVPYTNCTKALGAKFCYEGLQSDVITAGRLDPLTCKIAAHEARLVTGNCSAQGFNSYKGNDPVFKKVGLWFDIPFDDAAAAPAAAAAAVPCDPGPGGGLGCSLNGICKSGACVCDVPWTGAQCETMAFAASTPATGKNLYNTSDPRNTWNGPIVTGPDGVYHIYVPIYKVGSLGGPTSIKHGVAHSVTGPWDWASMPDLPTEGGENPAFVVYPDAATGKSKYTLWCGGIIQIADSPDGPFTKMEGVTYPGGCESTRHPNQLNFPGQISDRLLVRFQQPSACVQRIAI